MTIFTRLPRFVLAAVLIAALSVCSFEAAPQTVYFHADALGSPVAASDANGNLLWTEHYQPFGSRIENEQAAGGNRQWFTGKFHDEETGLTYLGARLYDPTLGRFMGFDPIGFTEGVPSSFNRYAYGANNPYVYTDPNGKFLNFVFGGIKAAVENVVIQHIEIKLGLRDEFSWGEFALDTTLGVATSGASTLKSGATAIELGLELRNKRRSVNNAVGFAAERADGVPTGPVRPYEVGRASDLRSRSAVGDELDIHHAGQAHPMEQLVSGYDRGSGPAIAVPRSEHLTIPTVRGSVSGSARDQLAKDIRDLRNYTNAPNSNLQELIELNRTQFPEAFRK